MRRWAVILIVTICGVSGCKDPDTIESYRIEKSKSGLSNFDKVLGPASSETAASPARPSGMVKDRMVVAIANRPDATWYFKITGPVDAVTATESQWRPFLDKISFNQQGAPQWELPDGWTVGAAAPMRFATLVINPEPPPLELRVSRLGPNQDPVSNVNRWRKQLQLPDISAASMNLATMDNPNVKLELFDEQGVSGSSGMSAPFSGPNASRPLVQKRPSSSAEFVTPAGWEEGRTSSIVKARLLKTDGEQSVQISVTEMPAAANRWLPNAKRWAGEIGIDDSQLDLDSLTSQVTVDGLAGKRIRLVDPSGEGTKATIGLMIVRGDSAWFFKLTGNRDLVKQSEKDFNEFLNSYRFETQSP